MIGGPRGEHPFGLLMFFGIDQGSDLASLDVEGRVCRQALPMASNFAIQRFRFTVKPLPNLAEIVLRDGRHIQWLRFRYGCEEFIFPLGVFLDCLIQVHNASP